MFGAPSSWPIGLRLVLPTKCYKFKSHWRQEYFSLKLYLHHCPGLRQKLSHWSLCDIVRSDIGYSRLSLTTIMVSANRKGSQTNFKLHCYGSCSLWFTIILGWPVTKQPTTNKLLKLRTKLFLIQTLHYLLLLGWLRWRCQEKV